jgi:DeoR family fructose operon transcriptional repressor
MYEIRKRIIFDLLSRRGTVTIAELQDALAVSDMTVRRDIQNMADEGLLRRVHGGAVAVEAATEDRTFLSRQVEELERKRAIAGRAIEFLQGGESIYLDGSTTCGELSKLLATAGKSFLVVTDSLYVLLELNDKKNIEMLLLGGMLDKDGNTFDGVLTVENARKMMVDCCFFSARGFSPGQISNAGMTGSQVKQLMIRQARKRYLLADSTKYGCNGIFKICDWDEVDVLISDDGLPESELAELRKTTEIHRVRLRVPAGKGTI